MVDFITLAESLGVDLGEPPRVEAARCLNQRFRQRACTECETACPVDAIRVDVGDPQRGRGPRVSLDEEACARCGLCLHVCPAGAFTHLGWQEQLHRWIRAAARWTADALEVACPIAANEPTRAPVDRRLPIGRCLAAVSLPALLDMVRPRKVDLWLNDTHCASCPLAPVHEYILRVVRQANALLETWGHPARVRTPVQDAALCRDAPVSVPAEGVSEEAMTRRDLFRRVGEVFTRAAVTVAAERLAAPPPDPARLPPHQRLTYHVPWHRRHLTAALRRLGKPAASVIDLEGLPWVTVQVNDACSACGLCARFCPTAAIRFYTWEDEDQGSRFMITFKPSDCVACDICLLACPEDAIRYRHQMYTEWLIADEEALLYDGTLVPCEDCGQPTAEREVSVCYTCAAKRKWQQEMPLLPPDLLPGQ